MFDTIQERKFVTIDFVDLLQMHIDWISGRAAKYPVFQQLPSLSII